MRMMAEAGAAEMEDFALRVGAALDALGIRKLVSGGVASSLLSALLGPDDAVDDEAWQNTRSERKRNNAVNDTVCQPRANCFTMTRV